MLRDYSGLVYLELLGARASVKAVWARMATENNSRQRAWISDIKIDGESLVLATNTRYRKIEKAVGGLWNLAFVHPHLSGVNQEAPFYFLTSDEETCPPDFFQRLQLFVPLPFKTEWAPKLWERAMRPIDFADPGKVWDPDAAREVEGMISRTLRGLSPLQSQGDIQGYILNAQQNLWKAIIKEIL